MGEARSNKAGAELRNCKSGGDEEKQGPGLRMGDVELILHKRHERRKNETSQEIQKKKGGNEEDRARFNAKGFWNGTGFFHRNCFQS